MSDNDFDKFMGNTGGEEEFDFFNSLPNIEWMQNKAKWVIRTDTIEWIARECKFNKEMSNIVKDMSRWVLGDSKAGYYLQNNLLMDELTKIVQHNLNLQVHIAGKTGSGKSMLGQKLGFLLTNTFKENAMFARAQTAHKDDVVEALEEIGQTKNVWDIDPKKFEAYSNSKVYVEFTTEECNSRLSDMNFGDVLVRDEQSESTGEGSIIEKTRNTNLKKAVRAYNINFIDCQPEIVVSATNNFVFLTLGFSLHENMTMALMFIPIAGSGQKISRTVLFCKGYVAFYKHENTDFIIKYEERKMKYIKNLLDEGGNESTIGSKQIIDDAARLIKYVKKDGMSVNNAKDWDLAYTLAEIPRRSTKHPDRVINYAQRNYNSYSNKVRENKQDQSISVKKMISDANITNSDDPFLLFQFNPMDYIDSVEIGTDPQRNIKIWKTAREFGRTQATKSPFNISHARVGQIVSSIDGSLDRKMGHVFEDFVEELYKSKKVGNYEIVSRGVEGNSDLVVRNIDNDFIEILSLKCSYSTKKEIYPIDDCHPEIMEYLSRKEKGEKVKLFLEWVNTETRKHVKQELDENNLEYITTVRLY